MSKTYLDWNKPGDDVYDERTFDARFRADLRNATRVVIVESPYIKTNRLRRYETELLALAKRGVRVCVFSDQPWDWDKRNEGFSRLQRASLQETEMAVHALRELGAHVTLRKRLHVKTAIIDGKILWRGSLNILSFADTIEEMVRQDDPVESLRTIKRRDLHQCSECAQKNGSKQNPITPIGEDLAMISGFIVENRERLAMSQRQLASLSNVDRSTLAQLETGRRIPSLEVLVQVYGALGYRLAAVPDGLTPYLEHVLQIAPLAKSDCAVIRRGVAQRNNQA